jgi:HEAT repeat protein
VSYESILQERTPDEFRGRVFAAFEFVTNAAFLCGALFAGWLGSRLGIRLSYVFSGVVFLCAALICRAILPGSSARGLRAFVVGFDRTQTEPAQAGVAEGNMAEADVDEEETDAELLSENEDDLPAAESPAAPTTHVDPVVEAIIEALTDPAPQVRRRAAVELGQLRVTGAIPGLSRAFDDPDPLVREAVVRALASMPAAGVEPALVQALADRDEDVRSAAADHLVLRRSDAVVAALGAALDSPTLHDGALQVLMRIGPEWFGHDLSSLQPERRRGALEALAEMGGPAATDAVVHALTDPEPGIRVRAVELAGRLGDPAANAHLERAVDDPTPEVATAAREALAMLASMEQGTVLAPG